MLNINQLSLAWHLSKHTCLYGYVIVIQNTAFIRWIRYWCSGWNFCMFMMHTVIKSTLSSPYFSAIVSCLWDRYFYLYIWDKTCISWHGVCGLFCLTHLLIPSTLRHVAGFLSWSWHVCVTSFHPFIRCWVLYISGIMNNTTLIFSYEYNFVCWLHFLWMNTKSRISR